MVTGKRMGIRLRLILSFMAIGSLAMIAFLFFAFQTQVRSSAIETLHFPALTEAQLMHSDFNHATEESLTYLITKRRDEKVGFFRAFARVRQHGAKLKRIFTPNAGHKRMDLLKVRAILADLSDMQRQAERLFKEREKGAALSPASMDAYVRALDKADTAIDHFIEIERRDVRDSQIKSVGLIKDSRDAFFLTSLLIFGLSLLLGYLTARSIAEPISALKQAAQRISGGDLETELKILSKNEISELASAFNSMKSSLKANLIQLQKNADEANEIRALSDRLQSCRTLEEATTAFAHYAPALLPEISGAVYQISASRNDAVSIVAWGDSPPKEKMFAPDDCWALRQGHTYVQENAQSGFPCAHFDASPPQGYACIPLLAQGDALGVAVFEKDRSRAERKADSSPLSKANIILAQSLTERFALALSNINLQTKLRSQSIRDPLTGLFNRRYMEESLSRELIRAARHEQTVLLMMIDLDNFKEFNDAHGHAAGDALLQRLGLFFKESLHEDDIACRYGGDEFVLIMPDAPPVAAAERADEIRLGARNLTFEYLGNRFSTVAISIGVSVFPANGTEASTLLKAADDALYRAKASGRDRAVVFGS